MDTNFNKISKILTNSIEKENDLNNEEKLEILVLVKKIAKDNMDLQEKNKELKLSLDSDKYHLFVQSNEKKKDKMDLLTTKLEACIIIDNRKKEDHIGQWFNECVDPDPEDTTPFKDLCSCYQNWLDVVYSPKIKLEINLLKERLISWQKSKYGFDDKKNGSMTNPKINMKIKD